MHLIEQPLVMGDDHEPHPLGVAQLVREDGRLELRLSSAEPGLPLPADVVLKVKHKALGVEVAPPILVSGEAPRLDLLGDDAMLVGEYADGDRRYAYSLVREAEQLKGFVKMHQLPDESDALFPGYEWHFDVQRRALTDPR